MQTGKKETKCVAGIDSRDEQWYFAAVRCIANYVIYLYLCRIDLGGESRLDSDPIKVLTLREYVNFTQALQHATILA